MKNGNKVPVLIVCMALVLSISSCKKAPFEQPNIVFIMSDDHSPNAISCYGNRDITTPGIDRLAREGIRFTHAMTPNSFCTPSRAMLLTGKYAHVNGTTHLNQPFDGSQQTYPKLLQQAGYQTSIFGKWHLLTRPTGFDYYCLMKMQGSPYDPRVFEPEHEWIPWKGGTTEWNEGGRIIPGYGCDVLTDEALKWLENRDPSKPFCLLLHPKPPHEPYVPAKRYEGFLDGEELPEPESLLDDYEGRTPEAIKDIMTANRILLKQQFYKHLTEDEQETWSGDQKTRKMFQGYLKDYYRLVMSVDDNVNKVLDFLRDHDLEKNTIVVYTTDNGFFLGEHGFYNKQWMYEPSLHVPLIIRYPALIKEGSVNASMVNHTDIAPTLLELAGLPVPADMQGKSLKTILSGEKAKVHEAFYYHFYEHGKRLPEMVGVRTERYKLISYPGMEPEYQWELFDLKVDRDEMKNLYGDPGHSKIVKELRNKLDSLLIALGDPVVLPELEIRMK